MKRLKLLAISSVFISATTLTGCFDSYPSKAEIVLPAEAAQAARVNPGAISSVQVMYFDERAKSHVELTEKEREYLKPVVLSYDMEFKSAPIPPASASPEIVNLVEEYNALVTQRNSLETEWGSHLKKTLEPHNAEAKRTNEQLTSAKSKLEQFTQSIQSEQAQSDKIKAAIDAKNAEFHLLANKMFDAFNSYIVEAGLPVRTLSSFQKRDIYDWYSRRTSRDCRLNSKTTVVDNRKVDGFCYYITLPEKALKDTPVETQYREGFPEVLKINNALADLKKQSKKAEKALSSAKIVAENKLGRVRDVNREIQRLEYQLERINSDIEDSSNEYAKTRFLSSHLDETVATLRTKLDKYSKSAKEALINLQTGQSQGLLGQPFEVKPGASYMLVSITLGKQFFGQWIDLTQDFGDKEVISVSPLEGNNQFRSHVKRMPAFAYSELKDLVIKKTKG